MAVETSTLRDNIARVQDAIAAAAARANRDPDSIKLVAVSKTKSAAEVAEAVQCGLRCFGENRVQEAATKIPEVAHLTNAPLEWHLIGTLQRNKVRAALGLFTMLESVDSLRLAEAIDERAGRRLPVLLEVYLGAEPDRPGFRPDTLREQYPELLTLRNLEIRGLMTVAPLGLDEHGTRAAFAALRALRDSLQASAPSSTLPELSMGMTEDYPLAIAEGATIIRVGRAIFGARP